MAGCSVSVKPILSRNKPILPLNRCARRRALYARTQALYSKNRSRVCKEIVSGDWDKDPGINAVSLANLTAFWKLLLKQASAQDNREPEAVNEVAWGALSPIHQDEVTWALKLAEKKTAPGMDGVTIPDRNNRPRSSFWAVYLISYVLGKQPWYRRKPEHQIRHAFAQLRCLLSWCDNSTES